jgi:hypothetical protein
MQQASQNAGQEGHYGLHVLCNIQSYQLNMFRVHSSVRRSSSSDQCITVYSESRKCLGFNFHTAPQEMLPISSDASKGKVEPVLLFMTKHHAMKEY